MSVGSNHRTENMIKNMFDENIFDDESQNCTFPCKRMRTDNYNDDKPRMAYHVPDKYTNYIFTTGENEIHFNTQVDGETITRLKKLVSIIVDENKDKLVKFDKDGNVPVGRTKDSEVTITYIVNSPGGSVHDVLDFVDYIGFLRCTYANIRFTSIITGMVASAGTTMCVIADKKLMTRFAFAMIHELSTGLGRTNFTRVMTHAEFIQDVHNVLVTIYQENRGIDVSDQDKKIELEALLRNETWMSAEKYKALGFVDEIIASAKTQSSKS